MIFNFIKKFTEQIDRHVQEDSVDLIKKSSEIVKYRKLRRNANVAINQISMCLPFLELYANLEKLMKNKKFSNFLFLETFFRYLQALKVLEDLEHNYLEQMQKYRFTNSLTDSISPIRDRIREKSYSELTDFLEYLQKVSQEIGEDACRHVNIINQILILIFRHL